jgi:4-hydroxybenzoate polyprenyltransferase
MLGRVKRWLRAEEWWNSEPPMMMAVAYGQLGGGSSLPSIGSALGALALYLVAILGLAGFGYVLNDFGDREADRLSGASNQVLDAGMAWSVAGLFVLVALSVVPWFFLPAHASVLILLALEPLLFLVYVLPPIRLKSRGGAGVIADACYAYVVPLLVTLVLFAHVAHHGVSPLQIAVVAAWALLLGVRHILAHQLVDAGRDERAGTPTFALAHGWNPTLTLLERVCLLELLLFPIFLITFGLDGLIVLAGFALHTAWVVRRRPREDLRGAVALRDLPVIRRLWVVGWEVMSGFHVRWMPVLFAAALAVRSPAYLLVLALHLLIFDNPLRHVSWRVRTLRWQSVWP